MWQKMLSVLKAATITQKVISLIALAAVLGMVIAIPVLSLRNAEPVDNPSVKQTDEVTTEER